MTGMKMMMPPRVAKMAKVFTRLPAASSERAETAKMKMSSQCGVPERLFTAPSPRGSRPFSTTSSRD